MEAKQEREGRRDITTGEEEYEDKWRNGKGCNAIKRGGDKNPWMDQRKRNAGKDSKAGLKKSLESRVGKK